MNHVKPKVGFFLRVSKKSQDYYRQELELKNYCREKNWKHIFTVANKVSGMKSKSERTEVSELFTQINRGNINKVVVTEISRLGRIPKEIRHIIEYLHERKVSIVFKNLGGLESLDDNGNETVVGNIIIAIHSELAADERKNLVQRIKSGLDAARKNGKRIGRPEGSKMDTKALLKKYPRLSVDLKAGISIRNCMKIHTLSKGTVLAVKKATFRIVS